MKHFLTKKGLIFINELAIRRVGKVSQDPATVGTTPTRSSTPGRANLALGSRGRTAPVRPTVGGIAPVRPTVGATGQPLHFAGGKAYGNPGQLTQPGKPGLSQRPTSPGARGVEGGRSFATVRGPADQASPTKGTQALAKDLGVRNDGPPALKKPSSRTVPGAIVKGAGKQTARDVGGPLPSPQDTNTDILPQDRKSRTSGIPTAKPAGPGEYETVASRIERIRRKQPSRSAYQPPTGPKPDATTGTPTGPKAVPNLNLPASMRGPLTRPTSTPDKFRTPSHTGTTDRRSELNTSKPARNQPRVDRLAREAEAAKKAEELSASRMGRLTKRAEELSASRRGRLTKRAGTGSTERSDRKLSSKERMNLRLKSSGRPTID